MPPSGQSLALGRIDAFPGVRCYPVERWGEFFWRESNVAQHGCSLKVRIAQFTRRATRPSLHSFKAGVCHVSRSGCSSGSYLCCLSACGAHSTALYPPADHLRGDLAGCAPVHGTPGLILPRKRKSRALPPGFLYCAEVGATDERPAGPEGRSGVACWQAPREFLPPGAASGVQGPVRGLRPWFPRSAASSCS